MRRLLELIRIIVIFAVVGSALGYFLTNIYLGMGIDTENLVLLVLLLYLFCFLYFIEISCNSVAGMREKGKKNFQEK